MGSQDTQITPTRRRSRTAIVFAVFGIVLIAAAVALAVYNLTYANSAAQRAENVLQQLDSSMPAFSTGDYRAPTGNLASIQVDGVSYAGIVDLGPLELRLPVFAAEPARTEPGQDFCPYVLSYDAQSGQLLLAGANYDRQFGRIDQLAAGDLVSFTDAGGATGDYRVEGIATVAADDAQSLADTVRGSSLALVVPTYSGLDRTVVCCQSAAVSDYA